MPRQIGHVESVGLLGADRPATNGQVSKVFFSEWSHRPAIVPAMPSTAASLQATLRAAASFNNAMQVIAPGCHGCCLRSIRAIPPRYLILFSLGFASHSP